MASRGTVLASPGDGSPRPTPSTHPHRTLRALSLTATTLTFVLIGVGALVRATGSGDACPDWPRCFGRWIPHLQAHVLIEYSHRFTATLDIVAVALLAVYAWRRYRSTRRVVRPAVAAFGLIVVQALLGGIVVLSKLEALNVTLHLGTAMVLAGTLVLTTVAAYSVEAVPSPRIVSFTRLARWGAGWALALILVGGWVRGAGASLAFGDWPLMDGRVVPNLSVSLKALQFTHRVLALGLGVLLVVVLIRAVRLTSGRQPLVTLAAVAAGLYVGQVVVGATLVWTRLSAPSIVAHVALSSLIWGTLVALAAASRVVGGTAVEPAAGLSGVPT